LEDKSRREERYREVAISNLNPDACKKIRDHEKRDLCLFDIADEDKDTTICKFIFKPELRGPLLLPIL